MSNRKNKSDIQISILDRELNKYRYEKKEVESSSISPSLSTCVLENKLIFRTESSNIEIIPKEEFLFNSIIIPFCKQTSINLEELHYNFYWFNTGNDFYFVGRSCGLKINELKNKEHIKIIDILCNIPGKETAYNSKIFSLGNQKYNFHFFTSTPLVKEYGKSTLRIKPADTDNSDTIYDIAMVKMDRM